MREKVIVLNSGGFDSIVLMHILIEKGYEPLSIFFRYGQNNLSKEEISVKNVCAKFNTPLKVIDIPKIDWSSNDFYGNNIEHDSQYLELRNLIFLSFALSYAQGKSCDKVFLAILKDGEYSDTTSLFVEKANELANTFSMQVIAPFIELDKYDLGRFATKYKIKEEEFFSCNTPLQNSDGTLSPCGKCADCLDIKGIYDSINNPLPVHAWLDNNMKVFNKVFKESPITELRALINNECQFDCKHCFYGFKYTESPCMTFDQWCEVIDQAYEMGIHKIHFSGKEPLYDLFIFKLMDYMKYKYSDMKYDVVTNGLNVVKFKDSLKQSGLERIFLSVDDFDDTLIRPTGEHLVNTIKTIQEIDIPIQIFIDVNKGNYEKIVTTMKSLVNLGVKEYYVRAILPLGNDRDSNFTVEPAKYDRVIESIIDNFKEEEDLEITVYTSIAYTMELSSSDSYYTKGLIDEVKNYHTTNIVGGIHLIPEFYCGPYESQVTVTPDGYVLGCATEVSSPRYFKVASGNVLNTPLDALIQEGKENTINRMRRHLDKCEGCYNINKCYHTN